MAKLMPNQDYPGGWVPPGSQSSIVVIYIDDVTPYVSLFVPYGGGINGGGSGSYPPHNIVKIPTWRDMNTGADIETITVTLPPGRRWEVQTYANNFDNNRDFKDFVIGEPEYVPINITYQEERTAFLFPGGVDALNGSFTLDGTIELAGNMLVIKGKGETPAKDHGKVEFSETAYVYIDGKLVNSALVIRDGSTIAPPNPDKDGYQTASILLSDPELGQTTLLVLEGNYIFTSSEGEVVLPLPPYPIKIEVNIQVREKPKQEQK